MLSTDAHSWLSASPTLTLLGTSRLPLKAAGERILRLDGLQVSDGALSSTDASLRLAVPAFGLFMGGFGMLNSLLVQDAYGVRQFGGYSDGALVADGYLSRPATGNAPPAA